MQFHTKTGCLMLDNLSPQCKIFYYWKLVEHKKISGVALTQLSLTLHYSKKNILLSALHSY